MKSLRAPEVTLPSFARCAPFSHEVGSCSQSGGLCTLRDIFGVLGSWFLVEHLSGSLMYPGSLTSQGFCCIHPSLALPRGSVHTSSLETGSYRYSGIPQMLLSLPTGASGVIPLLKMKLVFPPPKPAPSVPFRSALSVLVLLKPSGCEICDHLGKPGGVQT